MDVQWLALSLLHYKIYKWSKWKITSQYLIFYKKYIDNIINRRKKHEEELLLKTLNNYHHKIKLTIEINPPKFLDTEIIISNNEVVTSVHRRESKLPVR